MASACDIVDEKIVCWEAAGSPVPEWLQIASAIAVPLGATFTTLGVLAALYVVIRDNRRFSTEEERRRADQARLVRLRANYSDPRAVTLLLTNLSSKPIFDVVFVEPTHPDASVTTRMSYPQHHPDIVDSIGAGGKYTVNYFLIRDGNNLGLGDTVEGKLATSVMFLDAQGVPWSLSPGEQPTILDT
ncbi:hypothetical protein JGU71_29415 [Antrihabitans sp. YC3-6]|uniref:Uncharacterized protein n=1 Tax=Antrihabitans stalagmiti TaxID=2799499 RepID=A0A934U7H2_9NOCA|nr:hypothetical protein [Antrihabitans stalagmiti]MBJ8343008.1 hypothetical protein [Antrihabitans stalagmiti]